MRLTDSTIKTAKLKEGHKQQKHADGGGLYLLLSKSGKYWRYDYRHAGKRKTLSLGVYPTTTLKQARKARDQAKELLSEGIDPNHHKQERKRQQVAAAQAATFEGVAIEFMATKKSTLAASTHERMQSICRRDLFPWIGKMRIKDIKARDVLDVCQRIEANGYNESAHRAKMLCGQIMRYGVVTGRIESDPTKDLQGALIPVKAKHRPCITDPQELGGLMRAIHEHKGTLIVHTALMLSPYVFLRPYELRCMRWEYVDLEAKTITYPAHEMKMKQVHIVPLSMQAVAILEDIRPLTGGGIYVFHGARTASRPMSGAAINAALRAIGYDTKTQHTAHGFRGTASTLLHEQGFNTDHIERQLAHKEGNAIKASYNHARHLPERIVMMQAWADYLDGLRDGATVIPIMRKA